MNISQIHLVLLVAPSDGFAIASRREYGLMSGVVFGGSCDVLMEVG